MATAFDSIGSKPSFFDTTIFMLSLIIPVFGLIPIGRRALLDRLGQTMRGLADKFIAGTSREVETDKSVIGLLGNEFN